MMKGINKTLARIDYYCRERKMADKNMILIKIKVRKITSNFRCSWRKWEQWSLDILYDAGNIKPTLYIAVENKKLRPNFRRLVCFFFTSYPLFEYYPYYKYFEFSECKGFPLFCKYDTLFSLHAYFMIIVVESELKNVEEWSLFDLFVFAFFWRVQFAEYFSNSTGMSTCIGN